GTVCLASGWPAENRGRDLRRYGPIAPPLSRLFDASARLSLAGCVPAASASVSPRRCTLPQAGRELNPPVSGFDPPCGDQPARHQWLAFADQLWPVQALLLSSLRS